MAMHAVLWAVFALALVALGCIGMFFGVKLAYDLASIKYRKQLHRMQATYDAAATLGSGLLMESFTLGWLNLLVQASWVSVIEKYVSALATEKLQIILNEVLAKNRHRSPWKFIDQIAVEEVTFGLVPPQFQYAFAKYDPQRSYLSISMDMKYQSSGFQAVLTPRLKQISMLQPLSVRLEITHLSLSGRLNLGLHLTKEAPGIKGLDYSFAQPPEFDIRANPVGYLNLSGELPGLVAGLRTHLQKILTAKLVEPARKYIDVQRIYRNKHVLKVGGPGGCLRIVILGARQLTRPGTAPSRNSLDSKAQHSSTNGKSKGGDINNVDAGSTAAGPATCDPFVEMRIGREVFRTPIVHKTADPVWNWQFDVKLPADLGSGGFNEVLGLKVLDAVTLGDPQVMGSASLALLPYALQPNAAPTPALLALWGTRGEARGTLQLQLAWLKAAPKKPSPFPNDRPVPPQTQQAGVQAATIPVYAPSVGPASPEQTPGLARSGTSIPPSPVGASYFHSQSTSMLGRSVGLLQHGSAALSPQRHSIGMGHLAHSPLPSGQDTSGAADGAQAGGIRPSSSQNEPQTGTNVHYRSTHSRQPLNPVMEIPMEAGAGRVSGAGGLSNQTSEHAQQYATDKCRSMFTHVPGRTTFGPLASTAEPQTGSTHARAGRHKRAISEILLQSFKPMLFGRNGGRSRRTTHDDIASISMQAASSITSASTQAASADRGHTSSPGQTGSWSRLSRCGGPSAGGTPEVLDVNAAVSGSMISTPERRSLAGSQLSMTPILPSRPSPLAGVMYTLQQSQPDENLQDRLSSLGTPGTSSSMSRDSASRTLGASEDASVHHMQSPGAMHGMHRRNLSGMSQRQLSDVSETHEQASPPTSQTAQDTHYTPGPSYMRGQAQSHAEDASPARAFRGAAGVSFHSPFSAKLALLDNEENEAGVAGAPSLFLPGYPTVHGLPPHPQLSPLRPQLAQPEKAQDTEAGSALAPNLGSLPAPPLNNVFTGSLLVAGGGDAGAQHASLGSSVGALQSLGQVVKLQRALAAERAHVGGLTEALAASQRSHDALVRLRRAEGLRALIEGASFRLHTHGMDVWRPVQLWYSPQDEMLCVAEVRSAGAPAQTSSPAPDVLPRAFPPQALLRVILGSGSFPRRDPWAGLRALLPFLPASKKSSASKSPLQEMACLSLMIVLPGPSGKGLSAAGSARMSSNGAEPQADPIGLAQGLGVQGLADGRKQRAQVMVHLSLPWPGNGRSRDEWASALEELAALAGSGATSLIAGRNPSVRRGETGLAAAATSALIDGTTQGNGQSVLQSSQTVGGGSACLSTAASGALPGDNGSSGIPAAPAAQQAEGTSPAAAIVHTNMGAAYAGQTQQAGGANFSRDNSSGSDQPLGQPGANLPTLSTGLVHEPRILPDTSRRMARAGTAIMRFRRSILSRASSSQSRTTLSENSIQ